MLFDTNPELNKNRFVEMSEPQLLGFLEVKLCSSLFILVYYNRAGMHNIRPAEAFYLARTDRGFVYSPCLVDRNTHRRRKNV